MAYLEPIPIPFDLEMSEKEVMIVRVRPEGLFQTGRELKCVQEFPKRIPFVHVLPFLLYAKGMPCLELDGCLVILS